MRKDAVTFYLMCIIAGSGFFVFPSTSVALTSQAHADATVVFAVS